MQSLLGRGGGQPRENLPEEKGSEGAGNRPGGLRTRGTPVKAYSSPRAQQHPPRHLRPAPRYFPASLLFPSFSEWMGVQYSRVRGHSGARKALVWVLDMQIVF